MNNDKTICELFAGVGGFRLGLERLNSGWDTVWFSQWEPNQKAQWAHKCYVEHFGDCADLNGEYHTNDDISTIDKNSIPDHSVLVGGFPCQDYSVAQSLSTSKGIEGKKGVLWWQIRDVLKIKRPAFCLLENVDRLLASPASQRGRDFGIILACFYELGYSVEWRVVNAAKYGAAQKRRRTFIFAYRDDTTYGQAMSRIDPSYILDRDGFMARAFPVSSYEDFARTYISDDVLDISNNFSFDFKNAGYMHSGEIFTEKVNESVEPAIPLGDILQTGVPEHYYISDKKRDKFARLKDKKVIPRISKTGFEYTFSEGSMPFPDVLTEPGRTILTSESSTSRSTHIVEDPETNRLRTITPVEAERLQGFDDEWTNTGMPLRSRYFCMGNALVVPMVTRMGEVLDDIIEEENGLITRDKRSTSFLYDYQMDAVNNMRNGCILNGGVGSGKSRTGLFYYFKECGGWNDTEKYTPMTNPKDLYIITTARKRDTLEWEQELNHYLLSPDPEISYYKDKVKVVIDSWNNIKKYANVYGAFFIFDEDRVTGSGAWVKAFLNIARKNKWFILSATPGDTWTDYIPVFIANGFYRNKTEFIREHVIYSRFTKYPKIDRYINTGKLIKQRNDILVDMDFDRKTNSHHEDVYVKYDIVKYKEVGKNRWNPYTDAPIKNASELCYTWRKIVNSDQSRQIALLEIFEDHPRMIIFYNYNYELDILRSIFSGMDVPVAEWNGHIHNPIPTGDTWVYLVQYTAGAEGWNCITTNTIVFYSQNYSYKIMQQSAGRIDRLNTPYTDLYYYHLKSRSGIDLAISRALQSKKNFNEGKYAKW